MTDPIYFNPINSTEKILVETNSDTIKYHCIESLSNQLQSV